MDDTTIKIILYIVGPTVLGVTGYLYKSIINRIDELEEKIEKKVTETVVRQILADKLDPLREDLKEIKDSIRNLFELYLNDFRKKD